MVIDDFDDFNKPPEVAKLLKTSIKAVYGGIKRQEIPAVRVGRLYRIPGAWLRRAAALTEPSTGD